MDGVIQPLNNWGLLIRALPRSFASGSLAAAAIKGSTNSRIHPDFLPEWIAFNQSVLRDFLPECIAPRTTQGCHTFFSRRFQYEILFWFTCKRMWRRSWLTLTTLAFVFNAVPETACKSGRLIVTSYDFKLSMLFLSSLASVVEFLNQMKRNRRY